MTRSRRDAHRAIRGATIGCTVSAFLIAYGELYPFDWTPPPSAAAAWHAFLSNTTLVTSGGDMLGNVVLAVPLALFGSAMLRHARRRGVALTLLFAVSLAGMFALQAAQIWFPPRDASLADVFWHGVGLLIGIAAYETVAHRLGSRRSPLRPGAAVPVALLAAWLLTQLAPFVPSLDWQLVKDQLRPLFHPAGVDLARLLSVAGRVLAAGWLFGWAVDLPRARCAGWFALVLLALLAAKLVIAGQGWRIETLAGYGAGWLGCIAAWRLGDARGAALAGLLLLAGYTLAALSPLAWQATPSALHWMPFEAMLTGAIEVNAWGLVEACYVFGSLLWLARSNGAAVRGVAVALAVWVFALEWLQRWLPGRTSDITLPLLALALGWALHLAAPASRDRPLRPMPVPHRGTRK